MEKGYKVAGIPRELLSMPKELKEWISKANPDMIFHLAAYGNHHHQEDEDEILSANVIKTYLLLKATLDIPYKAFINVSTSSVYGKKSEPMSEKMALDTDTFYGCTKACGEYLVRAFAKRYNKPIVNVRPFSVYGPGEADFRFIPTVIRGLKGEEFTLYPKSVHDWIYIEDFIDGLLGIDAKKLKGKAINIGTGVQTSNKTVVRMLEKISGHKAKYEEVPSKRGFWQASAGDPKHTLEEGLKKTYEYYSNKETLKESLKENPKDSVKDVINESLRMVGQSGFK